MMIEVLFGLALASAVPLGLVIAIGLMLDGPTLGPRRIAAIGLAACLAVLALVVGRGPVATILATPWWLVVAGGALVAARSFLRDLLQGRILAEPWRLGAATATGFLAVGATWLVLDRAAVQPFGFDRTIVLLTAVHFHVAGFVLTLTGSLAARRRPGILLHALVAGLIAGTPLTALGFFGFPLMSWIGAVLVAMAGIGIGYATITISRGVGDRPARSGLAIAGATLFVTMPLAAGYATGTTFGIPFLDIPAMAAIHGGLNVVGFAIPAMVGWQRAGRTASSTSPTARAPSDGGAGPVRPGDVISFNRSSFVAGPAIGVVAILSSVSIGNLPDALRIGVGLAGLGALVATSAAVLVTWRVFGPEAPERWAWIRSVGTDSARWLNLTTGFDDSTATLRATLPGRGSAIDVFDSSRTHAAALRLARAAFPPASESVPVAGLPAVVDSASVDTVFLLMSAHETHDQERRSLFAATRSALAPGGRLVLVEHLRDRANVLAFGPGAWHFSDRDDWLRSADSAGLELLDERGLGPWVRGFVFGRAAS
ncbi:MAG: YndJ family protein [Chloroflexota bacterium]|nr:YndJ family protein [Chloroflexota bacterium]